MSSTAELLARAVQLHQAGQGSDAEPLYRQILQRDPRHTDALHLMGLVEHQQGRYEAAAAYMQRSLAIQERQPIVYSNLGETFRAAGQLPAAQAAFARALALNAQLVPAHYNLGRLFQQVGHWGAAVQCFEQVLRLESSHADAHNQLGNALRAQGQLPAAEAAYRAAWRVRPNYAEAVSNLGAVLVDQGRHEEAVQTLQQALEFSPDSAVAHFNLGNAHAGRQADAAAIDCYQLALRLRPELLEAHCNLGVLLRKQGQLAEAEACFRQALELNPDWHAARDSLGTIYQEQRRLDEAAECFGEVLRRDPQNMQAHYDLGLVSLLREDYAQGWEECEWRWWAKVGARKFSQPAWDGAPLAGKTILVHAEQGYGDTLQFIRYVPLLEEQGAKVIVAVQPPLVPLLRQSGLKQVFDYDAELPAFDVQALLMSLPRLCRTRADNIPANVPYLSADPQLTAAWRERLAPIDGFRVGINWQGNPAYTFDYLRSVPLVSFASLAEVPGVSLINLQRKNGLEQLPLARERFTIHEAGGELDEEPGEFMNVAAVMQALDLVITSDTSFAHLAGALGVPVWVALSYSADWRWLLDRDDSPWYPTMRLFRQPKYRDWAGLFQTMAGELARTVENSTR